MTRTMIAVKVRSAIATPAHQYFETAFPENAQATALSRVSVSTIFRFGIGERTCGYNDTDIQK